jgi:hypothetical protein
MVAAQAAGEAALPLVRESPAMKQREITDSEGTAWTCVQAFSGAGGKLAEKLRRKGHRGRRASAGVCTPSGGARSVRLELASDWLEELSDEDLLAAMGKSRS